MFNLDQAIAGWRRQMLAAGVQTPVPLEELESHLREDVDQQIRSGMSWQQAFETAVQRIGLPRALEAEFTKIAKLKQERERRLKLLGLGLASLAYLTPLVLTAPHPWNSMRMVERWLGLTAVGLTVVSMFSGLYLYRFLPVIREQRTRTRIQWGCTLPLFVWLVIFAYVLLPKVEWTIGQVTVLTLWAICPLSLFGGLICGLDEAAQRRRSV
jgi:hypothetical protein